MPRNPEAAEAEVDRQVQVWNRLRAEEPELAYRMIVIRLMMEQRGISSRKIAEVSGYSHESIAKALRPAAIRLSGEPNNNVNITVGTAHVWMDRIEETIGEITAEAGGVFALTGTTPESRVAWEDHVHEYSMRRLSDHDYE